MIRRMEYLQSKICIVGGGPAGATASLFLSRYGIPHLLVDKAHFPRDKVCGESFDGRVYRILEELSPDYLPSLEAEGQLMKTWNYRFLSARIDLPVHFPATSLPRLSLARADLDHFLHEQLRRSPYANVLYGYPVQDVCRQGSGFRLQGKNFRIDAELVLMATGAQPMPADDPSLFLFSRTYYDLPEPLEDKGLEVYYFEQPVKGCLFLCPLSRGRYNVEIGVQQAAYKAGGIGMEALLQAYIRSRPELAQRFSAGRPLGNAKGTGMLLRSKKRWTDDGLIFIGSGAFCVNPITGLGVGNAMTMGKLAAGAIRDHIDHPFFLKAVSAAYRRSARRKFRRILAINRMVNIIHRQFFLFEPLLSHFLRRTAVRKLLLRNDLLKKRERLVRGS